MLPTLHTAFSAGRTAFIQAVSATALAAMALTATAGDIIAKPPTGGNFVVQNSAGSKQHVLSADDGKVSLPQIGSMPPQTTHTCHDATSGLLGPCAASAAAPTTSYFYVGNYDPASADTYKRVTTSLVKDSIIKLKVLKSSPDVVETGAANSGVYAIKTAAWYWVSFSVYGASSASGGHYVQKRSTLPTPGAIAPVPELRLTSIPGFPVQTLQGMVELKEGDEISLVSGYSGGAGFYNSAFMSIVKLPQ